MTKTARQRASWEHTEAVGHELAAIRQRLAYLLAVVRQTSAGGVESQRTRAGQRLLKAMNDYRLIVCETAYREYPERTDAEIVAAFNPTWAGDAEDLLDLLRAQGFDAWADSDNPDALWVTPVERLSDDMVRAIKANKRGLLDLLREAGEVRPGLNR